MLPGAHLVDVVVAGSAGLPLDDLELPADDLAGSEDEAQELGRRLGLRLGAPAAMYANVEPTRSKPFGRRLAWDPVRQKEVWRHEHVSPWNGAP